MIINSILGLNFLSFLLWERSFLLLTPSLWPSVFLSGFDYVGDFNFIMQMGQNFFRKKLGGKTTAAFSEANGFIDCIHLCKAHSQLLSPPLGLVQSPACSPRRPLGQAALAVGPSYLVLSS